MAKAEQSWVIIEPPNELKFKGPFTKAVASYMKLTNTNDGKICFKIKTTAPRRYCVRPNSGIIEPNKTVEVAITLQPFDFDVNEKNKHKFMVQTVIPPEGDFNIDTVWKEADPSEMLDYKLRCVFENPVETREDGAESNSSAFPEEKAKRVSENQSSGIDGGDLQKGAPEVTNLSEDEKSNFRQEYLSLQEEILRLRLKESNVQTSRNQTDLARNSEISLTMIIALAIVTTIVGIVLGKFVL